MSLSIKQQLIAQLDRILSAKLEALAASISSTQESRDSDTKSSAGDKFETSREMAQIELNNLENQAEKTARMLNELKQLKTATSPTIGYGSIVTTNHGTYFLSIPYGKLQWGNTTYFVISMASPIGQQLNGKTTEDTFAFNGQNYKVTQFV
ncbi:3-oxoacyl-ACP synthase [bacterium]|nr:3-oxoacyl-ACP synthase [bacterium]